MNTAKHSKGVGKRKLCEAANEYVSVILRDYVKTELPEYSVLK